MKKPLPKVSGGRVLTDWVTVSLREAILHGYFKPGEKLDQDLIAQELEVSRTPVREAVVRLQAEGFVEIRPRHGAFIPTVSVTDINEISEMRSLLEGESIRQATPNIPDDVLNDLEQVLLDAKASFQQGDPSGHFESDIDLHSTINEYVENSVLKEMMESLNGRIIRIRSFTQLQTTQYLEESFDEHLELIAAMRKRDPDEAEKSMKTHVQNSRRRALESMQYNFDND